MSATRFDEVIQPLQKGQLLRDAVNPERLNALATLARDAASGTHMRAGPGLLITRGSQGTILRLKRQIQRGNSPLLPLDCYVAAVSDGNSKVQIRAGSVLGVMPKINGKRLDDIPEPYLNLSNSDTVYVVINIEVAFNIVDDKFVTPDTGATVVNIELAQSDPGASGLKSADGDFKVLLATYVDGKKTLQNGHGPITGEWCDTLQGSHTAALKLNYPSS